MAHRECEVAVTIVTLAIALCGLLVAVITGGWNIFRDGFRDRARLKLTMWRGQFARWAGIPDSPWLPKPGAAAVFVKAANVGRRPITITGGGGVQFSSGAQAVFTVPMWILPKKLEEGDEITLCTTEVSLREAVQKSGVPTHIWFRDASDRMHRKRIPENLRPWLTTLINGGASAQ